MSCTLVGFGHGRPYRYSSKGVVGSYVLRKIIPNNETGFDTDKPLTMLFSGRFYDSIFLGYGAIWN